MFPVLYLLFGVPLFIGTYVVLYWFVSRDGSSGAWVLLPLGFVLVLVLRAVAVGGDGSGSMVSTDSFGLVTSGLWLACFAGWLTLLTVASVRWVSRRTVRGRNRGG